MSILGSDMERVRVSPILKWAGGKQGIASRLVELFPQNFDRYFEPFVGGGVSYSRFVHQRLLLATQTNG